jgi:poly(3-hydroxybutyrate) depolymerase
VKGHGHEWPGAESRIPAAVMGPKTNMLDATERIWTFFRAHPKPAVTAGDRPRSS